MGVAGAQHCSRWTLMRKGGQDNYRCRASVQQLLSEHSEPFALGQSHVHHDQVIGVRAQGGKPCLHGCGRGHCKVGGLGLLEEPCKAGRIAWGRHEDKELIY